MPILAKFKGHPDPDAKDGNSVTQAFGKIFRHGQPTDVSDLAPAALAKLRGNSHFEVVETTGKADKKAAPVSPAPAATAAAPSEPQDDPAGLPAAAVEDPAAPPTPAAAAVASAKPAGLRKAK